MLSSAAAVYVCRRTLRRNDNVKAEPSSQRIEEPSHQYSRVLEAPVATHLAAGLSYLLSFLQPELALLKISGLVADADMN